MASADLRDELSCSICLNIYTDPVTLRCGHNFCWECITDLLDTQDGTGLYTCPECRENLQERPALRKNSTLSNIAQRFHSLQLDNREANIFCTNCTQAQVPAVIYCQNCEAFLCDQHLRVHSKSPKHVFSEPVENKKCSVHKITLQYFCATDSVYLCVSCKQDCELNGHHVESLDDVAKGRKETFRNLIDSLSSKRNRAEEKIQSLKWHNKKVNAKAQGMTRSLNTMYRDMKEQLKVLVNDIQSEVSRQAEKASTSVSNVIKHLEVKKDELYSKMDHLEQLCNVIDPLLLIQQSEGNYFCDDEEEPYIVEELDEGLVLRMLHLGLPQVMKVTEEVINREKHTDLLLDIDTAANNLLISEDLKSVSWSEESQNRPEKPQRFQCFQVLSVESFSSGQHQWEVETSEGQGWAVGMCYPSIERNGDHSIVGNSSKSWGLWGFRNKFIMRHDCKHTVVLRHNPSCHKLRILLDYEAGELSFHEMGDNSMRQLHTVTTTFTEPLHALLWVSAGNNHENCTVTIRSYEKVK